jgi:hypothetical protein
MSTVLELICKYISKLPSSSDDNKTISDFSKEMISKNKRNDTYYYDFDYSNNTLIYDHNKYIGTLILNSISNIFKLSDSKKKLIQPFILKLPNNVNLNVINSDIVKEINDKNNANSFFVLASQLNGAEYTHFNNSSIVKDIKQYIYDQTSGPLGQYAITHSVGQFILDNASNTEKPSGINCVKDLLNSVNIHNPKEKITLINGYLQIPEKICNQQNSDSIWNNIHKMLLVGMKNAKVVGHTYKNGNHIEAEENYNHYVNMIYASAIPIETYTNYYNNDYLINIANSIMIGQYMGAIMLANNEAYDKNSQVKIFLLPLGGGVFNNQLNDIFNNIIKSILIVNEHRKLHDKLIINILTYSGGITGEIIEKKLKELSK